jgi:SAM-dependent methyltransferase
MTSHLTLRSPQHDRAVIQVPDELFDPQKTINGSICSKFGDEYPVKDSIVDLLGDVPEGITMAQRSNHWSLTATVYENTWRVNSLGILTGENFPIAEEQRLLTQWVKPEVGERVLDVGCSTALYARALAKAEPGAHVVALDFSQPMLEEARRRIKTEGLRTCLIRADAGDMPFFVGTFDAIVIGGSLNEFADPRKVLYECRRVLKPGGRLFNMHLLTAGSWYGRILQQSASLGGLQFWTRAESNQLFEQCGFRVDDQIVRGIVCFSLMYVV